MSLVTRRHRPGRRAIELTPLVDVSLTLVVFMLLNNQRGDLQQLPVSLPATSSSGEFDDATLLRVIIDRNGLISCDGDTLELEELAARVDASTRVTILADRDCRHGDVIRLVDRLRGAGAAAVYYASEELDDAW